jgi:pimeloyl-ACP methyl ester carboxylesterase
VPSTMALFKALTQYPSLQRLLEMRIPTLVVLGERDPLLPGSHRINEIASQTDSHVLVVLLEGAAHAINFSHPDQLAHVIRMFMEDQAIENDPRWPGHARLYEVHRGKHHPSPKPPAN